MSLTQYLLEFSICLALFYGLYHFLLRRETFFQLNRWYLLLSPALSMIIPFLNWELPAEPRPGNWDQLLVPLVSDLQQPQVLIWENLEQPTAASWSFTYLDLLLLIYLAGMLWMGGQLLARLWRLMRLIGRGRREAKGGYTVVTAPAALPAASFLSYVFWEEGPLSPERRLILEHELVHVRQWHSLDVILMEVWVMLKWFHPLIYWYRRSLRITHEYIADNYVSRKAGSRLEYARLLTSTREGAFRHDLLHRFHSSLKMRLLMLAKHPSKTWKYAKYLLILPATAFLMLLFSFNLSAELPDALVDPLEETGRLVDRAVHQPLLSGAAAATDHPPAKAYRLQWGDITCDCRSEQFPNYYHCENQSLLPRELRRLIRKEGGFSLYLEGRRQAIRDLTAVSKFMKDMGGFQGQFDEMDQNFNTESPLWRQAEKGDVFRFTFSTPDGDHFEFDVVMNNRREEFIFGSRVELGHFQFNINLTNDRGIVHLDVEELQNLARLPLQVRKNNEEYYQLAEAVITNRKGLRQDEWRGLEAAELDISRSRAILDAFPEDRVNFELTSEAGETIQFDVLLRKNSSWDGRKREHGVQWGDQVLEPFVPRIMTREEIESLKNEEMYLLVDGRKLLMKDKPVNEASVLYIDGRPNPREVSYSGVADYLEQVLPGRKAGDWLHLSHLKSVNGYPTPPLSIIIDQDWRALFADHPGAGVLKGNRLVIEGATPEDLQRILSLENFKTFFYDIEVDGQKRESFQVVDGEVDSRQMPSLQELVKQGFPRKRLTVSRKDCLSCP